MAFEREKIQRTPQFLGQIDKKEKSGQNVGRKKPSFWKTVVFFSNEFMLELNSKGKDLVRQARKTRLESRFFEEDSFFCETKLV